MRAWLGHVSLATTNVYAEVDLEMKAKALASCEVQEEGIPQKPWREDKGLLEFLRANAPAGAGEAYGRGHDQATGGSLSFAAWDEFDQPGPTESVKGRWIEPNGTRGPILSLLTGTSSADAASPPVAVQQDIAPPHLPAKLPHAGQTKGDSGAHPFMPAKPCAFISRLL